MGCAWQGRKVCLLLVLGWMRSRVPQDMGIPTDPEVAIHCSQATLHCGTQQTCCEIDWACGGWWWNWGRAWERWGWLELIQKWSCSNWDSALGDYGKSWDLMGVCKGHLIQYSIPTMSLDIQELSSDQVVFYCKKGGEYANSGNILESTAESPSSYITCQALIVRPNSSSCACRFSCQKCRDM